MDTSKLSCLQKYIKTYNCYINDGSNHIRICSF